jgi:hypothetical protein
MPGPDPQGGSPGIAGAAGRGQNSRKPAQLLGPVKKEYTTKIVGLESDMFDVGNAKYAAKFQKSVDGIAIHIQREYKGGPDIAKAIRDLNLPTFAPPTYPDVEGTPPVINPGKLYMW